jgi:Protein of unknown function (DUF2628)
VELGRFGFGFAWLPYRQMYLYSFIYIGALLVETLLEYAVGMVDKAFGISVSTGVYLGLQGNRLYRIHAENRVRKD